MSLKERRRIELLARVRDGQLRLVKAAELLPLSYRQLKRVWARYRQQGDAGLVHRLRGRRSNRAIPEVQRARILARYQERYPGFGPTFASEHLATDDGYQVAPETLRRWLLASGDWKRRRKRGRHRQWRARREHRGELVQMDGSHHDWFEGRRAPAVLMVLIDDATNETQARFYEVEDTPAAMDSFGRWVRRHGRPLALYVDLDSIYRVNRDPSLEEQLQDRPAQTQFGRAMAQLDVQIVPAYSPQAKGRVERRHGLLQDRLVKELRLAGIGDLERANEFLDRTFLPQLNRRFRVPAANRTDLHRPLPRGTVLEEVLSLEETRAVGRDWTLCWQGRFLQIEKNHAALSLAGKRIIVRQLLRGALQLVYRGHKLSWKQLPERPRPQPLRRKVRVQAVRPQPPQPSPWRKFGIAAGRPFWRRAAQGGRGSSPQTPAPLGGTTTTTTATTTTKGGLLRSQSKGTFLPS